MQALFFGNSSTPLYGVIHEPRSDIYRNSAILICQPFGHEYFRTHRSVVRLSDALSRLGYSVLRFDYGGTGDSHGQFRDISLESIKADVICACNELQAMAGVDHISVIAVRLGALFTSLVAEECRFKEYIFWDGCFDGKAYMDNLRGLHKELLSSSYYYLHPREAVNPCELLGYLYNPKFVDSLQSQAILQPATLTGSVKLIETGDLYGSATRVEVESSRDENSQTEAGTKGDRVELHRVEDMGGWDDVRGIEVSLSNASTIKKIQELLG